MQWSKDKPKEPGWYWWRKTARHTVEVVDVLAVEPMIVRRNGAVVELRGGQWQGPITPQD